MKAYTLITFGIWGFLEAASAKQHAVKRDLATCPVGGIIDATNKFCCPSSCGQCGGSGCDKRTGGSSACCTSQITKSCASSGLPCIASGGSPSSNCPTGGILDATGKTCCSATCGQCGGTGCHLRTGGAAACCTSQVSASCSTGKLPCVISGSTTPTPTPTKPPVSSSCPAGSIPDGTGKVCCSSSCGQCGGTGCHLRTGGAAACCTSQVTKSCTGNQPPCLLTGTGTQPPTNSCPAGGILDASGKICCTGSCGTCGGSGCDKRPGGPANCCTGQITASCAGGKLPCVLSGSTSQSGFCKDGKLSNFVTVADCSSIQGCCPKSCNTCFAGPSDQCTESPECCVLDIRGNAYRSDVDVSCRSRGPPCIMPPVDDPCTNPNPCQDGARCGFVRFGDWYFAAGCVDVIVCECDEVGNDAGQFCEINCKEGESPCGTNSFEYGNYLKTPNSVCCPADEDCIVATNNYSPLYPSSYSYCLSKKRPMSCNPNPCLNGGICKEISGIIALVYECVCPSSAFTGLFCEIEN